jgi:hypothetical protein
LQVNRLRRAAVIALLPWNGFSDAKPQPEPAPRERRDPLKLARYYQSLLDSGKFENRAALARYLGVIYQSKTDMLRGLPPDMVPLVNRSVSCSRPSRYQNLHVRHCGYCVPCIYRRAAMIEAGLDKGIDEYAFDAFLHLQDLKDYQKVDFRALVRFAERHATASEIDLEMTVLAHGYFSPDVGARLGPAATTDYSPWTTMLRSWSQDFLRKMRAACSPQTLGIVGLNPAAIEVSSP